MGWRGGNFSVSYGEIMSHLYDGCKMADGSINESCVRRVEKQMQSERDSPWARLGVTTPTESMAYRNWQQSRYGGNVQAEAFLGPFERPAAEYAMKTKGRVNVAYGDALPTSYEVSIQGPHGAEREFETEVRGFARQMQQQARKCFDQQPPENLEEERDLMKQLEELFRSYRRLL